MIRSLRIFCDVVDTQSFTKAGQQNYLTQSAISQHLKSLEQKFGHQLIERERGRVLLTPAGRLVYAAAQEIVWRYQRLERLLEQPPKEVSGVLRIAASLTVGLYELPPYLSEFLKTYPKVELKLAYLKSPEVYNAVLQRHAEIGLVAFPEPHPQLIVQLFKKDQLVVIVPPRHSWVKRGSVSLQRLRGQPFVAVEAGSPMRREIDRVLERARVQVKTVHEFDNIELIKRAVEVGVGMAIVPQKTVSTEVQAGTLAQLRISEGPLDHPVGILTRRQAERPLAVQKLITALLSPSIKKRR